MYTGRGFNRSELGDVDILRHDGMYHLFHLVLPNHDYIAHAVSVDGLLWRRVRNALFIGEPGDWDDDMLWTMHVSRDPDGPASWRMFYTGISRREGGRVQRIGLARSPDLYHWEKAGGLHYPLSIEGPHYESSTEEGRHWVSCRDPFFFIDGQDRYLLVDARVPSGPVARRGCVGIAREVSPDSFVWEHPLFVPRMYDDIEVPVLSKIGDEYYLVGNIREDIKVHYWHSPNLRGPFEAHADNVLLPKGNYAVRLIPEEDRLLLWNFYISGSDNAGGRILPPPAELKRKKDGTLYISSYSGFDDKVQATLEHESLFPLQPVLGNPTAEIEETDWSREIRSVSGYEVCFLKPEAADFRLRGEVCLEGLGKFGLVIRSNEEASGYYISLDVLNGFVQTRFWGTRDQAELEEAFEFTDLQESHFQVSPDRTHRLQALAWGGYLEFSIDGIIVLRLVDTRFMKGTRLGFYVESAVLKVSDLSLDILDGPEEEDHGII
jgi:beta-fructofuranosidase